MRYPVVLFDFDGTVIDSGAIILASMRHAAETVLGGDYSDEQLLATVGEPGSRRRWRRSTRRAWTSSCAFTAPTTSRCTTRSPCATGWTRVLDELKDRGHRLGIVTAKRRRTVDLAFANVPIEHLFDVVVGSDDTARQKPDPAPLLLALERLGAEADEAAYIGDSPFDMQAARAAGLHAIGVAWGRIHPPRALTDADVVVESPGELLDLL